MGKRTTMLTNRMLLRLDVAKSSHFLLQNITFGSRILDPFFIGHSFMVAS